MKDKRVDAPCDSDKFKTSQLSTGLIRGLSSLLATSEIVKIFFFPKGSYRQQLPVMGSLCWLELWSRASSPIKTLVFHIISAIVDYAADCQDPYMNVIDIPTLLSELVDLALGTVADLGVNILRDGPIVERDGVVAAEEVAAAVARPW